jgi:hypothetical protein
VMALSLAGLLMGPAVPNTTGRVIMIAPMLKDLVEALGYRPQSKAAAGLAMAALIGFGQMGDGENRPVKMITGLGSSAIAVLIEVRRKFEPEHLTVRPHPVLRIAERGGEISGAEIGEPNARSRSSFE